MRNAPHVLDMVGGIRLMSACWLFASIGCATLQMRLLAQVWHQSGSALAASAVSAAWLLGMIISSRRCTASTSSGLWLVIVILIWLACPALRLSLAPVPQPLVPYGGMCVCSFILGFTSTSWLTRPRPFPQPGERVLLCRGMVGSTLGLVLVWLLPGSLWSSVIGLVALVPLLLLDAWPQSSSPLPAIGGLVERLSTRVVAGTTGRATGLNLEMGALPRGWWISYLAARGRLSLTVFASVFAVIMGALWSALPTVFAANLASTHQLSYLVWVLFGQLFALASGLLLLSSVAGRRAFGSTLRLLPESWRNHGRFIALALLLVMAAALVAVGLSQSAELLAISLYCYTLAAFFWGLLLPRLQPSISAITLASRHIYREPVIPRLLPLRQLEEDLAQRRVGMTEALGVVMATPVFGALLDHFTVDEVFIFVGCGLIGSLAVGVWLFSRAWGESPHAQLERWYCGRDNLSLPRQRSRDAHDGHHSLEARVEA